MTVTNYVVSGMTCQHCVHAVTEEVSAIASVDEVSVTLADGSMQVTSNGEIPVSEIEAAVAEAGDYTVVRV
jgi:copper chaperone